MARAIYTGAVVHQHDRPWAAGAGEILADGGRIIGVGKNGEFSSSAGSNDHVINLPGGRLLPAFYDAHLHLDQGGRFLANLQLTQKLTSADVLSAIHEIACENDGEWLVGIGLNEHALPTLAELDAACPSRPLLLHTRDYHSVRLNTRAIKTIDLSSKTVLPDGGWQEFDEAGEPLGILCENAARWTEQFLPEETPGQLRHHLRSAMRHLLSLGITGIGDAGDPTSFESGLLWLEQHEGLPMHIESWLRCVHFGDDCIAQLRKTTGKLRRNRLKLFIDGALGSHTGWMKEEYSDKPGHRSGPVPDLDEYSDFLKKGSAAGWSFTVHAIGDAGVEYVADSLAGLPAPAGRHRIEHIQHVDEISLSKLIQSNAALSVQPLHRVDDLAMLRERVGDRSDWAYPLRSLNVADRLVLGSDWPVVDCDPRKTIRASLLPRGAGEGMPNQHLTASEAVLAMTRNAAQLGGFNDLGSLEPGYLADMVWLDSDPGNDPDAWLEANLGAVWTGGKRSYRDNDLI
jgi:predicted amidohydrolase YtcJ